MIRPRTAALLLLTLSWLLAWPVRPVLGQAVEVDVVLDQFGPGDAWRPGEFVAMRLELTATTEGTLDAATSVWVQWEVPNADGDIAEYGRQVTLTRGQARRTWLYAPIDPATAPGAYWSVRVFDYQDGRRGRELGGARIGPPAAGRVDIRSSMIGVIGPSRLGLSQYTLSGIGSGLINTAMEDTRVIAGLRPQDLPDRWEGLKCMEAIAWGDALPADLPSAQAEALREWIRRGGHLIISLPEDTNPWGLGEIGQTELEDLFPTVAPTKQEDVSITDLLPVMIKAEGLDGVDFPVSIRVFGWIGNGNDGRLDSIDNCYQPLLALPDGRVVAIQRLFGHGRITLVGIDLANRQFTSLPLSNGMLSGIPQADVFWNRILGRRADTPSAGELLQIDKAKRLTRATPGEETPGTGALIKQEINMSGKATKGLLMALLLFTTYWFVAGPGGFFALKHYRRVRHAWLAFAAAAGAFTAFAWLGVNLLRQNEISVRHITFLDHVVRDGSADWGASDPQLQRAVSWLNLYMPGYGDTPVGIVSLPADTAVPAQRDLLVSWTAPDENVQKFPNVDRYSVDVSRDPDDYRLPSRSTATQLYANWIGGVDPEWGGFLRGNGIRVTVDGTGQETLEGSITNGLPGPLYDVTIIWVRSRHTNARVYARDQNRREEPWVLPTRSGDLLNTGRMWRTPVLDAGLTYELDVPVARAELRSNIRDRYVRPFEGHSAIGAGRGSLPPERRRLFMEMLGIYQQLTPPTYLRPPDRQSDPTMIAMRKLGRELDLSGWLNRPCLIVIGFLENSACPIPLRVDERPVRSEGTTVVRWIHPLEVIEEVAFPPEEPVADARTGAETAEETGP